MQKHTNKIVVIVGTNASGKSGLAVALARKFDGEVISADSRQVYTGLDIATGKITKEEMDGIVHHLIDVADPKERYSANDFATHGREALKDIWSRGKLPIIAGGTGFYIDALLGKVALGNAEPDERLRKALEEKSAKELFAHLKDLDSARAKDLKSKNEHNLKRRVIRAIEIATSTKGPLGQDPVLTGIEVLWIGIAWDDEALKARIHARTLARVEDGMIEEAKKLHSEGVSYERMEELGLEYKHLADYLRGKITKEELIASIDAGDWKYAKRQRTWFKRNKEIQWFTKDELHVAYPLTEEFLNS